MSADLTTASAVRRLRNATGLSQRAFAALVGTSGPTIAAYETGAKEPRLSTLERMADEVGVELVLFESPVEQGDRLRARRRRRHMALAAATADAVSADYPRARRLAAENLARMEDVIGDNRGRKWVERWRAIVEKGPVAIRRTLLAPGDDGDDMRQMQPFAGMLSDETRRAVLATVDALGDADCR